MRDRFPLTRLSQGHLNVLETCPRKFQHVYLDRFASPLDPEQQERLTWGSQFHLLMQQRELGLPIERLLEENHRFAQSITALVRAVPDILSPEAEGWREAEHYRILNFQDYLLSVIYDLLVLRPQSAQILDWKTYPLPQNRAKIAASWQTRLYLFVLGETSDRLPEEISMTYWFVQLPDRPRNLTFRYDRRQHERTRDDLTRLLAQLDGYLTDYLDNERPFPQVPEAKGECRYCPFTPRCQRAGNQPSHLTPQDWQAAIAQIDEVSL